MEYLVVRFPERRKVLVDGLYQGETGAILTMEAGPRKISLEPMDRCQPAHQVVVLVATTPDSPYQVTFHLVA